MIKKILISQPEPQHNKSPYFGLAEKYQVDIDFIPFIHVEGATVSSFKKQKLNLLDFSAVVLTSRTAADNYFRLAEEMNITIPISMKFFCLTENIAYYLQKYITYRKRKIFFADKTYDDLMKIMGKYKNEKFLLPVAQVHKQTILKKFRKEKFDYTKSVMYQTVSSDLSGLSKITYDLILFFSPADVKSLFDNFPDFQQEKRIIAVFGKTTANAAKKSGLRVDINVPTKEYPSMAAAVEKLLKKHNL
ncbi:MAG: uroporphyrinogen-III synthase [Bacteroidia bacterium]|nr:MAG: uroporphyrinogen-III synthase [Bacteroidia bacterium]